MHNPWRECDQFLDTLLTLCTTQPHRSARRILRASAPHAVPLSEFQRARDAGSRLWICAADRRDEQRPITMSSVIMHALSHEVPWRFVSNAPMRLAVPTGRCQQLFQCR